MTVPFMSYLTRVGLEIEEAGKVDQITGFVQEARSWIKIQAMFRSHGAASVAKAEAALILVQESVVRDISDNDKLLLVKAACAIYGYEYQEDLSKSFKGNFKKLNIKQVKDKKNKKILEDQYLKSRELSELSKNKGCLG